MVAEPTNRPEPRYGSATIPKLLTRRPEGPEGFPNCTGAVLSRHQITQTTYGAICFSRAAVGFPPPPPADRPASQRRAIIYFDYYHELRKDIIAQRRCVEKSLDTARTRASHECVRHITSAPVGKRVGARLAAGGNQLREQLTSLEEAVKQLRHGVLFVLDPLGRDGLPGLVLSLMHI